MTAAARLDAIEARADRLDYVIEHGSSDPLHATAVQDIRELLTLARKQAAALEAVEVLADWPDQILTKPKGDKVFHVEAHRIRAAIRAALGAGDE